VFFGRLLDSHFIIYIRVSSLGVHITGLTDSRYVSQSETPAFVRALRDESAGPMVPVLSSDFVNSHILVVLPLSLHVEFAVSQRRLTDCCYMCRIIQKIWCYGTNSD
jgi:hypothetical protein